MNAQVPDYPSAKARIIQAAMLLFARRPFSETSLRDIAAEAQVDVAYVHRAFGSKSEIFRQALDSIAFLDRDDDRPGDPDALIDWICERAFLRNPQSLADVKPLHLMMQSCACREAREIVNEFMQTSVVEPLARAFGHDDLERSAFAICILNGFISMRVILGNSILNTMPCDTLKPMLATALHQAMRS